MAPKVTTQPNFKNKLTSLARSTQLYWFLGHVLAIVFFFASLLFRFISTKWERRFFRLCIFSEIVSYGCILKQLSPRSFQRLQVLRNESVQYFAFAWAIFLTSFKLKPWSMVLTSFVIYSFFHSITYFQANFLDFVPISLQAKALISERITFIASNYNEQALYFASLSEITLLQNLLWEIPGLLFKVWTHPSLVLFTLINDTALVIFLKLRYDDSQYTKAAFDALDQRIGNALRSPMVPLQVSQFYEGVFKVSAKRLVGYIHVPQSTSVRKNQ